MIKQVFDEFTELYQNYLDRDSRADAIKRMNSGDCGTCAQAVGLVLRERYGVDVAFVDFLDHACLLIDGKYYDSEFSDGTDSETICARHRVKSSVVITPAKLFEAYNAIDAVGTILIAGFLKKNAVTIPDYAQYVIDHQNEFDSPEWLVKYNTKIATYLGE